MEIKSLTTPILEKGFIMALALEKALIAGEVDLRDGDILVISSKVVAVSQGRIIDLKKVVAGKKARSLKASRYGHGAEDPRVVELVVRESEKIAPGNMLLSLKEGILIPEAGIDLSNVPSGFAVLWPKDPMKSAANIRRELMKKFSLKKLGVVIADSHCQPLRWGTTGVAIGWAGFMGVEDARGTKDIYGKKLQVTRKAVADNIASGAMVVMGEGDERSPFALVRGAPVQFTSRMQTDREIHVKPDECIFGGLMDYSKLRKI